eukprot:10131761-Prorocentrum_lima.AAC.1
MLPPRPCPHLLPRLEQNARLNLVWGTRPGCQKGGPCQQVRSQDERVVVVVVVVVVLVVVV